MQDPDERSQGVLENREATATAWPDPATIRPISCPTWCEGTHRVPEGDGFTVHVSEELVTGTDPRTSVVVQQPADSANGFGVALILLSVLGDGQSWRMLLRGDDARMLALTPTFSVDEGSQQPTRRALAQAADLLDIIDFLPSGGAEGQAQWTLLARQLTAAWNGDAR